MQTPINVYLKSKRTASLPENWHPVAFPFKDEGVLAEHPLICHHQGCLAGDKMQESEGKGEKITQQREERKLGSQFY